MTYARACELLGFTTPKSLADNATLAQSRLSSLTANSPLRFSVACMVIIRAAM